MPTYFFALSVLLVLLETVAIGDHSNSYKEETRGTFVLHNSHAPNASAAFERPAICDLKKITGFGHEHISSYYFDSTSGTCKYFEYSGAGGNANRFESYVDCLSKCTEDPCHKIYLADGSFLGALRTKEGNFQGCEYASSTHQDNCPSGYYCTMHVGICCRQDTIDPCMQPMEAGKKPIDAKHSEARQFFYFDFQTKSCEPFSYLGLGGNQNRFFSLEACEDACVKPICENGHYPYSKMDGPIACSMTARNNDCSLGYRCTETEEDDQNVCCSPNIKLSLDHGGSYVSSSSLYSYSFSLTLAGVVSFFI